MLLWLWPQAKAPALPSLDQLRRSTCSQAFASSHLPSQHHAHQAPDVVTQASCVQALLWPSSQVSAGLTHRSGLWPSSEGMTSCAGIVQGQAEVKEVISREASSRVCLQFPERALGGIQVGASVAINGTCLTVRRCMQAAAAWPEAHARGPAQITDVQQDTGYFDIIEETLRATNLGSELKVARPINFERSVALTLARHCELYVEA